MNENIYNNMTVEQYQDNNQVVETQYNENAYTHEDAYTQWLFNYAADLMVNKDYNKDETINALMEKGVDNITATAMVHELNDVITEEKKGEAGTDIVLGLVFAIGGIVLSLNTNYIFCGAVIYGAFRFFKGIANL